MIDVGPSWIKRWIKLLPSVFHVCFRYVVSPITVASFDGENMADEISYYSDQSGVRVTDKRVIIASTTYSMANITSVSTTIEKPSMLGPILIMAIGVLMFLGGFGNQNYGSSFFGAIVAALGYFWYRGRKPIWHLRIASASGEATPLQSNNQQWIASIAQAINEAIIHRA
jgi:hypothetical protein